MKYDLIWEKSKIDNDWYGRGHWPFAIEYWIDPDDIVHINDNNSFIRSFDLVGLWDGDIEKTKINCNKDYERKVKTFIKEIKDELDSIK